MGKVIQRIGFGLALTGSAILSITTMGCASGGYKLTRQYSGWVNSQHIIIRIILYLLTSIIWGVTMLIDLLIFNTIDFWEGRISDGRFDFKDGDRTYFVHHETDPLSKLKKTTIQIVERKDQYELILKETPTGDIEAYLDGKLKTKVRNIREMPIVTQYDTHGNKIEEKPFFIQSLIAQR